MSSNIGEKDAAPFLRIKFLPESAAIRLRLGVDLDVFVPRHRLVEDFFAERALGSALGLVDMCVVHVLKWERSGEMTLKFYFLENGKLEALFQHKHHAPYHLARMVARYVLKQGVQVERRRGRGFKFNQ